MFGNLGVIDLMLSLRLPPDRLQPEAQASLDGGRHRPCVRRHLGTHGSQKIRVKAHMGVFFHRFTSFTTTHIVSTFDVDSNCNCGYDTGRLMRWQPAAGISRSGFGEVV